MKNHVRQTVSSVLCFVVLLCGEMTAGAEAVHYRQISREVIEGRLRRYAGSNAQREATLKNMFAQAGCDDQHLSEQPVKGSKLPNVICVLPGSSDKVIIVGAHFDRAPEGDGVVDNWSSASLLPSLYEALKDQPRAHTYIFIGFTDEERGEIGSRFYARQMTQPQVAATEEMVNMDTLGLGPTKVWATHSDKRLTEVLLYTANQLHLSVEGVSVEKIGASTDSEQFAERKIPRITIHSYTQKDFDSHILHSPKDNLSAMHLDDYYQTCRLVTAYLAVLDQVGNIPTTPTAH